MLGTVYKIVIVKEMWSIRMVRRKKLDVSTFTMSLITITIKNVSVLRSRSDMVWSILIRIHPCLKPLPPAARSLGNQQSLRLPRIQTEFYISQPSHSTKMCNLFFASAGERFYLEDNVTVKLDPKCLVGVLIFVGLLSAPNLCKSGFGYEWYPVGCKRLYPNYNKLACGLLKLCDML